MQIYQTHNVMKKMYSVMELGNATELHSIIEFYNVV